MTTRPLMASLALAAMTAGSAVAQSGPPPIPMPPPAVAPSPEAMPPAQAQRGEIVHPPLVELTEALIAEASAVGTGKNISRRAFASSATA
jgi:hypothetical protein